MFHHLLKRVVYLHGPVVMLYYAFVSCLPALVHAFSGSLFREFKLFVLFTSEKMIFTAMMVKEVAMKLDNL